MASMTEREHDPVFSKPKTLLSGVRGIQFVDFDRVDECCGFGGTFSVTEEAVAAKMGYDELAFMQKASPDCIVSSDMSCLMPSARMRTPPKTGHFIPPCRRNSQWSITMSSVNQAENAEAFLEDTVHEERLDKLLWLMRMRRDAAARRVPEWEELRTLASEIKEHTLSNLSHYLIEFEAKATANGITGSLGQGRP
jgi:hypothetical protein